MVREKEHLFDYFLGGVSNVKYLGIQLQLIGTFSLIMFEKL